MSDPLFNALFRKGGKTKELDLGMTRNEFEKLDKKLFDEGFRLTFLYKWDDGDGTYQAAWEPGDGPQEWLVTDDIEHLISAENKHSAAGLRLKYLRSNDNHLTALWRPSKYGDVGEYYNVMQEPELFKIMDKEMRVRGYSLMHLCRDGDYLTGFWHSIPSDYAWIDLAFSVEAYYKFDLFIAEEEKKGRRAVSFGGDQLCAVFHPGDTDEQFVYALTEKDFKKEGEKLFKEGYQIIDLFMFSS